MKYYKVITSDNRSQHGGEFDWTPYLPTDDGPGEWAPHVDPEWCESGYHVTPYPCMWMESETDRVFEVECKTDPIHECIGTLQKLCSSSIRLRRECSSEFATDGHYNSGDRNSGSYNSGYRNSGDYNSGDYNSGNSNSGDRNNGSRNSGSYNSGSYNSGYRNSASYNSGSYNSGYRNSGSRNSGHCNSGDYNSGVRNSGDHNSGDHNSGHCNSGSWNSCDEETGYLNTTQPTTIRVFNRDCDVKVWEKADIPEFFRFDLLPDLGYKGSWKKAWDEADEDDRAKVFLLPNFDADVFYELSGIDLRGEK